MTFEVLDTLEGLFELSKRSPTLDGSVPLRAAQACSPLLEGNAVGFQLRATRRLLLARRFGRTTLRTEGDEPRVGPVHRAALARLGAMGHLEPGGAFEKAFAKSLLAMDRGRVRLHTGLWLRPPKGVWLRVSGAGNRRNLDVDVEEAFVRDEDGFVPLVLGIVPRFPSGGSPIALAGELATVCPMLPRTSIEARWLSDAPEVGRAHVAFYDAAYFANKKGRSTRKYRKLTEVAGAAREPRGDGPTEVVVAGADKPRIDAGRAVLTASGPVPARDRGAGVSFVRFENLVPFEARFDGLEVTLDYDKEVLAKEARGLERTWATVFGDAFLKEHRGALLYLTKYFTPHVAGEPHFFVKPWAFVKTPPGWSTLVEGECGEGYDVLRGVVATDQFHATPAVFQLRVPGRSVRLKAGAPLLRAYPVPRDVLRMGYEKVPWQRA